MINSIQILRAIAAFAVFFTHYALFGLHIGGFGVDIFFIISGFVIAFVVNKSTKDFLLKRVIRVTPLYTIATVITALLAIIKPDWFKSVIVTIPNLIMSLLYIPYRVGESGPILSLGWTLNFEMFFYISLAICILFIKNKLIPLYSMILVVFLLVINIADTSLYPFEFYGRGLLPEFLYGLYLYYGWNYLQRNKGNKAIHMGLLFIGLLSLSFLIFVNLTKGFPEIDRNIKTGIPCFFVVLGFIAMEPYINGKHRVVKFLSLLGDASYAMYLFHPFILFGFTRVIFPKIVGGIDNPIMDFIQFLITTITLMFVSIIIYKYIDKPLNDLLRRLIIRKK